MFIHLSSHERQGRLPLTLLWERASIITFLGENGAIFSIRFVLLGTFKIQLTRCHSVRMGVDVNHIINRKDCSKKDRIIAIAARETDKVEEGRHDAGGR